LTPAFLSLRGLGKLTLLSRLFRSHTPVWKRENAKLENMVGREVPAGHPLSERGAGGEGTTQEVAATNGLVANIDLIIPICASG